MLEDVLVRLLFTFCALMDAVHFALREVVLPGMSAPSRESHHEPPGVRQRYPEHSTNIEKSSLWGGLLQPQDVYVNRAFCERRGVNLYALNHSGPLAEMTAVASDVLFQVLFCLTQGLLDEEEKRFPGAADSYVRRKNSIASGVQSSVENSFGFVKTSSRVCPLGCAGTSWLALTEQGQAALLA